MIGRHSLIRSHALFRVAFVLACLAAAAPVDAYHFFQVTSGASKLAVAWRTTPVAFVVDRNPASFQTTVQNAFDVWNNVPTAKQIFGTITLSAADLTGANYQTAGGWGFLTADGQQEVICDSDGTALAKFGLSADDTLGYGPSRREVVGGQGAITDTFFILNCKTAESADFNYLGTMVHELGHNIGLAHSSAYMPGAERLEPLAIDNAPTMYPYAIPGNDAASASLQADDIAGISELYPDTNFTASYATISGRVSRCVTDEAVLGVNVRAVSTSNVDTQITRYSGYNGNTTGDYDMKVPPGTYHLIIEVLTLPENAMAIQTRVDKDFTQEYRSNATEEADCTEEIPDPAVNVSAASPDESEQMIRGSLTASVDFKVNAVELAFVVDTTGSMGPEIAAVRTALTNTITRLAAETARPFPMTAIITFKDDVTVQKVSRVPATLQSIVNLLEADGGDDCPEWSNDAMLTAGRMLRRGGKAMLFTDADSHPDRPDAAAVATLFTAKGLTPSILLSGRCDGDLGEFDARNSADGMDPRRSQNPSPIAGDKLPPEPTLGDKNSVETSSAIVNATGGVLVAIPGIKYENPPGVETARYINTGTNIAVSAAGLPTVGVVLPGDGPRGTNLDIEVNGSNTNFQGASVVSFSGAGITVNSKTVRTATSMIVNITIATAAATGFRDITVTTPLGGVAEIATGVGAFNITTAPLTATVIGVTPSSGGRSKTLDVTIKALNTSFGATSQPLFCIEFCFAAGSHDPKIVVNTVTVIDATTLRANITIASDAFVGYRNVSVITGGSVANEEKPGPFLVAATALSIPVVTSVTPSFASPGQTLNLAITGANTTWVNGTTALSFSGTGITVNSTTVTSSTTATASITITAGATLGFRDVLMVTGGETAVLISGFSVTDIPTAQPVTGLYVASIVGNTVTLRWTNPVAGLIPTNFVLEGGLIAGQVLASLPTGSTAPVYTFTAPSGAFFIRLHTLAGVNRSVASPEIRLYVQGAPAPSTPANFLTQGNGSSVSFSWQDTFGGGVPGATLLDVTGPVTTTLTLPAGESASFAGVPPGTYTFRLRSSNGAGASAQTPPITMSFPVASCSGAPQAPSKFLAYKIGSTIYVLWEPPTAGAAVTSYVLVVTGAFNLQLPTTGRSMSGAVPPGTYNLSVRGVNACGNGALTAVSTVVIP